MESFDVELRLQSKMVHLCFNFEHLQFDKAAQRGKEMVALCGFGLRWGFRQRDVLFQRLVVTLDSPAFLVACRDVVEGKCGITCNQIKNANTSIFVCEDLAHHQEWKRNSFEVDFSCRILFYGKRLQ